MAVQAPTKVVRDYLNDSRVWADFMAQGGFVEGDIVIVDAFKAGTTWTTRARRGLAVQDLPWLDSSWGDHAGMLATLKKQREAGKRRVIKSHLPAEALPLDHKARYIFIARNGKDLGLSFHNYLSHFKQATMETINALHASWSEDKTPLVVSPNAEEFLSAWVDTQGAGCCDLLGITKSWWARKEQPNVLVLHYSRMLQDLPGTVRTLAAFVGGVDVAALDMDRIVERSGFEYMSANAEKMAPFGGGHMSSAKAFFAKGPERDFCSEMSPELITKFDAAALAALGPACCKWLETGEE